jgi:NAD(P)-dependent dehydrogenase (short-subunit alcohol dehydrogenase family)
MEPLKDQIALVTGGSGGIGSAIAAGLAERGAALCLTGQNPQKLALAADSISATSRRVYSRPMDLTNDADVRELAQFVTAQFGRWSQLRLRLSTSNTPLMCEVHCC